MTKRTRTFLMALPAAGALYFLAGPSCNGIPNKTTLTDTALTIMEPNSVYKYENFHLFNPSSIGAETDFAGTRACSLWVNGSLDSASRDSLYGSIRYEKDTVSYMGDSVRGIPQFYAEDIVCWRSIGYHFGNISFSLFGQFLKKAIDPSLYGEIKRCLDTMTTKTSRPPDTLVKAIVNALNAIVADIDFFYKNRDTLLLGLDLTIFTPRIRRLVNEGIFVDTTGKPKANPGIYEKTAIRWLTMEMLSSSTFDYPPPSEIGPKVFPVFFTCEHVHLFSFLQGATAGALNDKTCRRLMAFNKLGEFQIVCREKYADGPVREISRFNENRLIPFPYGTGKSWSVTPLYWTDIPLIPSEKVPEIVQPGRAVAAYRSNQSTGQYAYFDLTLYYPINGSPAGGTEVASVIGHYTVMFRYCRSVSDPFKPGIITRWNTEVYVRRTDSRGNITVQKEVSFLNATDPGESG